MKAGTYKLASDVANPAADRRFKDDWRRWPVWTAGTEFLVEDRSGIDELTYQTICMVGSRWTHMSISPSYEEQFAALQASLILCEPSDEAFLQSTMDSHAGREPFARWLLESGRLSRELFASLWEAYMDAGPVPRGTPLVLATDPAAEPLVLTSVHEPARDALLARATRLVQTVGAMDHRSALADLADLVHELALRVTRPWPG